MKKTMSLDGTWRLVGLDDGREVEACVPGEVHVDLHRAGVIPDPYFDLNAEQVQWVKDRDWRYERTFDVGEDFLNKRTFLEFDGLDTFATVFLNGREVGRAANMFISHRFDVTEVVRAGRNTVAVQFNSAARMLAGTVPEESSGGLGVFRASARKMQCAFGSGWVYEFAGAGIWRPVRLASYDRLSIADIHVEPEIVAGCANAWITVDVENHTPEEADVMASIVVALGESREKIEIVEAIPPEGGVIEAVVRIEEPALWWPNGFGEQPLYTVMVGLQHDDEVQDVAETRFGVRTVALVERDRDGSNRFTLMVNGEEVFCKGANWVPADHFVSRVEPERYRELVGLARDANFNMLRVWGGGIYESPAFYDACDEMGIMVWQDFMFACDTCPYCTSSLQRDGGVSSTNCKARDDNIDSPLYEAGNRVDDAFAQEVAREGESIVKRLRNHPSIVLWCGNDECEKNFAPDQDWPGKLLFREVIPDVLKRLDHTRPYRPSTPYGGAIGNDPAEGTWHGGSWFRAYLGDCNSWRRMIEEDRAPFVAEFYAQGSPLVESLREFISEDALFPPTSAVWEFHNRHNPHSDHTDGSTYQQILVDLTRRIMGEFKSVEEFAAYSGILQGEFVKAEIEHFRREKWSISGALYWMFNDCWPAIGWSLVDYYLRPKPAYYYAKRVCAPVIVSFKQLDDRVQVYVTSDERLKGIEGLLRVGVLTFDTCGLDLKELSVSLPPNSSVPLWESGPITEMLPDPSRQCLVALLESQGEIIAKNFYFAVPFGEMEFPKPKLLVEREQVDENRHRMIIAANAFARNVFIGNLPASARPSDNYFDLLPGEAYRVTIDGLSVEGANELRLGVWGR
ncbi:MAG: hypothetical protein N3B12_01315 [Armatimonadetes bacterium]|nr:hypothetical protein [Armatimonadota bacterium]